MTSKKEKIIFINGKFLSQSVTGVQRYSFELVKNLDNLLGNASFSADLEFILLVPKGYRRNMGALNKIEVKEFPLSIPNFLWEQIFLPLMTIGRVLLNLSGSAPLLKKKQYCTIHDAAIYDVPFGYTRKFIWWYKILFFLQSKICISILTVSEFSKSRLVHFLGIRSDRIFIIPNAADHFLSTYANHEVLHNLGLRRNHYFLAVGSANPTKNLHRLVEAFVSINLDSDINLVIVGGSNSSVFQRKSANFFDENHNIIYAGRVDDSSLKSLYEGAKAFLYPSLYEGFGIPPLEAMSCGCPVLVSDIPPLLEVCADAAGYFNPRLVESIASGFERAVCDDKWLLTLKKNGFDRAEFYSWNSAARKLLDILVRGELN
jgi:glycosyltransferase involved in cell wall biosynthesis